MTGVLRRKIRILRLIARLNVGGAAKHVVYLTAAENKDPRFETLLVAGRVEDNEEDMDYFAGQFGVEPKYLDCLGRNIGLRDMEAVARLVLLMLRYKPDIVDTHTSKAGFVGAMAAGLYNVFRVFTLRRPAVVVHTFHGHTFHGYFGATKAAIFLVIERMLSRFLRTRIIVLCEQQKREICETYRVGSLGQFTVLPLGIDLSPYKDKSRSGRFRKELGIGVDTVVVACVGRLTQIKNHRLFIDGAAQVLAGKPEAKVVFVIIGSGELEDELRNYTESLGLSGRILFTGNREDMEVIYRDVDILALTSDNEGTPVTVLEAMACGIAVVSTDAGGAAEILACDFQEREGGLVSVASEFKRGIIVQRGNTGQLAGAMSTLIEDEGLRREYGKNGEAYMEKYHRVEDMVERVKALNLALTA